LALLVLLERGVNSPLFSCWQVLRALRKLGEALTPAEARALEQATRGNMGDFVAQSQDDGVKLSEALERTAIAHAGGASTAERG
jgi:hypothetical protein